MELNFRNVDGGAYSSLVFALAGGATRPVLIAGKTPLVPPAPTPNSLEAKLSVSEQGVVSNIALVQSSGPWVEDALAEIKQWKFKPATINGEPIAVTCVYRLAAGDTIVPDPKSAMRLVPIGNIEAEDPSLPPPKLIAPENNAKFDTFPRLTKCRCEPSAGADSYLLEWDYFDQGAWQSEITQKAFALPATSTEASFDFVGAQPGRWRVWPVNAKGERGNPSEWRGFAYTR